MEHIEPFVMPFYRCKNCGKVISEPQLKSFRILYDDFRCSGEWCLCEKCLDKGVTTPKSAYLSKRILGKNTISFLTELIEIIKHFKVNAQDVFYSEEIMEKEFLGKYFQYGGRLQNLDSGNGNYKGVYLIVRPDNYVIDLNDHAKLERWKGKIVAVPKAELQQKLDGYNKPPEILYIGKSESNVRKRMATHCRFYGGKHVSAWGGRVIGQIENWEELEVWYLKCDNPEQVEKELIKAFKSQYGDRPFANRRD